MRTHICVFVCVRALTPPIGDIRVLVFNAQLQVNVWFPGPILLGPLLLNYDDPVIAFSVPLSAIKSLIWDNFPPVGRGGRFVSYK